MKLLDISTSFTAQAVKLSRPHYRHGGITKYAMRKLLDGHDLRV